MDRIVYRASKRYQELPRLGPCVTGAFMVNSPWLIISVAGAHEGEFAGNGRRE